MACQRCSNTLLFSSKREFEVIEVVENENEKPMLSLFGSFYHLPQRSAQELVPKDSKFFLGEVMYQQQILPWGVSGQSFWVRKAKMLTWFPYAHRWRQ